MAGVCSTLCVCVCVCPLQLFSLLCFPSNRLLLMEQEEDIQRITPSLCLRPPFPPHHMCPSVSPSLILFAFPFCVKFFSPPILYHSVLILLQPSASSSGWQGGASEGLISSDKTSENVSETELSFKKKERNEENRFMQVNEYCSCYVFDRLSFLKAF